MECSEKELDHAEVARVRVERATSPWKKTDTAVEVTAVATSRPRAQDGSQLDPSSPDTDTSVMTAQETYPEGGLQAWLVVLGSWLTLFASLGLMNTLAVLETYLASHQLQGYSHAVIGWIFSIYAFLCFFGGIYVGPVFDRHGPRWLLLGGSVCVVASLLILSICTGKHIKRQFPIAAALPQEPECLSSPVAVLKRSEAGVLGTVPRGTNRGGRRVFPRTF